MRVEVEAATQALSFGLASYNHSYLHDMRNRLTLRSQSAISGSTTKISGFSAILVCRIKMCLLGRTINISARLAARKPLNTHSSVKICKSQRCLCDNANSFRRIHPQMFS